MEGSGEGQMLGAAPLRLGPCRPRSGPDGSHPGLGGPGCGQRRWSPSHAAQLLVPDLGQLGLVLAALGCGPRGSSYV